MRILVLLLSYVLYIRSEVLHMTEQEFRNELAGSLSSNLLVEFYAPWCGHCKSLAPEYKIAGDTFQPSDGVKLIAIDATETPKLASEYGIKGFPTLKWFPKGSTKPEDYDGGRTAETIIKWINEKTGTRRVLKTAPSAVAVLTTDNFDSLALGSKAALVEFYAPWCGHCKQLAPKYEQVASAFSGDKGVVIGKVDCTVEEELQAKYGIEGFPTLKYFPAGSSIPVDYTGPREAEDMVKFINEHAGTQRRADGSLTASAGLIEELDTILADAGYVLTEQVVSSLKDTVSTLSETKQAQAKVYVSIAEKVLAQGSTYLSKEINRVTKMLLGNITPESKTNFQYKLNILRAFDKI